METQTLADTISVTIKPKHLKGTFYNTPRAREVGRHCPLQEALIDAGYPNAHVGYSYVRLDKEDVDTSYHIDTEIWCYEIVDNLIKGANEGSENELTLTLTKYAKDGAE